MTGLMVSNCCRRRSSRLSGGGPGSRGGGPGWYTGKMSSGVGGRLMSLIGGTGIASILLCSSGGMGMLATIWSMLRFGCGPIWLGLGTVCAGCGGAT
jgi:hypothetical protein